MTANLIPPELTDKHTALVQQLAALETLLVAYSGGTDSAYLAFVAHQVLGPRMLAVIADSASLPRAELAAALAFAEEHSIPVETLATNELANPDYRRNDAQRCFHCKDELFTQMEQLRAQRKFSHIAYGRNLDDDGDFRPGQRAAAMHHAVAPLADAGLRKAEIRALARAAGLSLADKPASACLSSRIEYGRAGHRRGACSGGGRRGRAARARVHTTPCAPSWGTGAHRVHSGRTSTRAFPRAL